MEVRSVVSTLSWLRSFSPYLLCNLSFSTIPIKNTNKSRKQIAISAAAARMATLSRSRSEDEEATSTTTKIIDSHLHVWASPQQAADKFPYFPGQEPSLPGHLDFSLQCIEEAAVDGAVIV